MKISRLFGLCALIVACGPAPKPTISTPVPSAGSEPALATGSPLPLLEQMSGAWTCDNDGVPWALNVRRADAGYDGQPAPSFELAFKRGDGGSPWRLGNSNCDLTGGRD